MRCKETTTYQVDINLTRAYRDWDKITNWLSYNARGNHHQLRSEAYSVTFEFYDIATSRKFVEEFREYLNEV